MPTKTPVLTLTALRAWGLDDDRVVPLLRAENGPGSAARTRVVGQRAGKAGWPTTARGVSTGRVIVTKAVRRLEGVDFEWNGCWQEPAGIYDE